MFFSVCAQILQNRESYIYEVDIYAKEIPLRRLKYSQIAHYGIEYTIKIQILQ